MSDDRSYLPDCWSDDKRMNLLFVDFRNKTVNPDGWNSKMKFWSELILNWSKCTGTLLFTYEDVCNAFIRNEKIPACLKTVLSDLESQKSVLSASYFIQNLENTGWISWGIDCLVKKPLHWSVTSVMDALNWRSSPQNTYICIPTLKMLCDKVMKIHQEHVISEWMDHCVLDKTLWDQCNHVISDRKSFEIILMQLRKEGKISISTCENQDQIIKFKTKDDVKTPEISDTDVGIIRLQSAKSTLENEIEELISKASSFREEASDALHSGNRLKAKMALARKQRIEKEMQKKEMTLFNIEGLLGKLKESDSQKKVIAAYETGVVALKKATNAVNLESMDSTLAEMEENLDLAQEIQDELSRPFNWIEHDSKELEDELDRMLEEEMNQPEKTPSPAKSTTSEEKELAELLGQMKIPTSGEPSCTAHTEKEKKPVML